MLLLLILFSGVGALLVDTARAEPLTVVPRQSPRWGLPLGSDSAGRDLLAVMIVGTPLTLRIGLIAGTVGIGVATVLAFVGAFYGGLVDDLIRWVVDALLTVPALLVLIILATAIRGAITVEMLALVVASLAWMWPTRTIRAQVLTMREQAYVQVAKLSGVSGLGIIFKEMMPNLIPYLGASFVTSVAAAILASIGLEALGLGSQMTPTLGMTIYWTIYHAALFLGMWWWWGPPIVIIVIIFISLFLITSGLDEIANPRARRTV